MRDCCSAWIVRSPGALRSARHWRPTPRWCSSMVFHRRRDCARGSLCEALPSPIRSSVPGGRPPDSARATSCDPTGGRAASTGAAPRAHWLPGRGREASTPGGPRWRAPCAHARRRRRAQGLVGGQGQHGTQLAEGGDARKHVPPLQAPVHLRGDADSLRHVFLCEVEALPGCACALTQPGCQLFCHCPGTRVVHRWQYDSGGWFPRTTGVVPPSEDPSRYIMSPGARG